VDPLLAGAKGYLATNALGAELGIARYKVTCMVVTRGMAKGAKVCEWSLWEIMMYIVKN